MKDEELGQQHRRKVENFKIRIEEEELKGEGNGISSYSKEEAARRRKLEAGADEKAQNRAQEAHKIRNQEKGRKNKHFFRFVWFIMVMLLSLLLAQYMVVGFNDMLAVNRDDVDVTVEIPQNASRNQVAQILYNAGAIQNTGFFRLYATLTKAPSTYKGGSYQIHTKMDYEALIHSVQSFKNRVDTVKITFTEGMDAIEITGLLEKNGVCSSKEALSVINGNQLDDNYEMLQKITDASQRYYKLEGYLFPDTYEFFKNEEPAQAIKKLVSNCNKKLTKQIREKAQSSGMTLDQMLTLASMIQAEAADEKDMYQVSSVFHNRLESKKETLKHLDSDPTTYYPYRQKSLVPENIRETYKSRYDTYTIEGLPPGPICNPGMDAIEATLNPASTKYYYFCHDKDGKAYYAKTAYQHQANLKRAGLR